MKTGADQMRREDGGVLVAGAIIMAALVLLGAALIQVGAWFQDRRHLQVRADAGALAGAQLFNECFDPAFSATDAKRDMEMAASQYAGFSSYMGSALPASYNTTFSTGSNAILFQSQTYPGGGGDAPDDTNTADECTNLALDVKLTRDVSGWFTFSPLAHVHAHARVQLEEVQSVVPSFPLAIPEVVPSAVGVTFVNEDTNTELTGCGGSGLVPGTTCTYALSDTKSPKDDPFNLGPWTISGASVALPTFAAGDTTPVKHIGMRVGVGDVVQSCVGDGNGNTWQCYNADANALNHGVLMIAETNPSAAAPRLQGVWPSTCSGTPFAGDDSLPAPCNATLSAKVAFASTDPKTVTLRATVSQDNVPNNTKPQVFTLSYDSTTGLFTGPADPVNAPAIVSVDPPTGGSEYSIDLCWKTTGSYNCPSGWTGIQRFVGATAAEDGPLDAVSFTDDATGQAASTYVGGGSHSLTIGVLLKAPFNRLTILRQAHAGSATAFILCRWKTPPDPSTGQLGVLDSGQTALQDALTNGCQVPYQVNATTSCNPDSLTSPDREDNPDCTQNKACDTCGNTITKALDARFGCVNGQTPQYPNRWPNYATPGDKRAVTLVTTSYGAFAKNGNNQYPVTGFGAFYIAGVTGNACGDVWPSALGPNPGANTGTIWGYFIKYANNDGTPSGKACKLNSLNNCVAVLTR